MRGANTLGSSPPVMLRTIRLFSLISISVGLSSSPFTYSLQVFSNIWGERGCSWSRIIIAWGAGCSWLIRIFACTLLESLNYTHK